jgi:uncharacterized Fe-S cluster protein YjdI/CDGSH-type Zn-finger protein
MSEIKRVQSFSNDKITVAFDPNVCTHSAKCIRELSSVFDVKQKRWINVNGDSVDKIVAQVKCCPSGALSYELHDESPAVEKVAEEEPILITIVPNGSARIVGKVRIVDLEGNLILETEKCSLCRCGLSEKKPFCDGAHKRAGWQGEAQSPPQPIVE